MWLLDTDDGSFAWIDRPREHRYAILSHVWRQEGEETFQDLRGFQDEAEQARKSMKWRFKFRAAFPSVLSRTSDKIRGCCAVAKKHGYRWVWIDSCCIDKTSSSELSEAINSMYAWYAAADVCFALLDDVGNDHDPKLKDSSFRRSRWFTRGWTLQELIAPAVVVFFSKDWSLLGTKEQLAYLVEQITGVDQAVLRHETPLDAISVARRMSWASKRKTTREEDRAYSLMGIFGINMPTIYGEGENAFIRLQEEILKHVPDQSIFAWGPILFDDAVLYKGLGTRSGVDDSSYWQSRNLLAWSPDAFVSSGNISSISLESFGDRVGLVSSFSEYHITSYGMRSCFPIISFQHGADKATYLAVLACQDAIGNLVALLLYPQREGSNQYYVGHYVGSPQVPPYAYFRAVSLSKLRSSKLLQTAVIQDVCIPYRSSLMGRRNTQRLVSSTLFMCPCDIVVPGWVASKLTEEGFAASTFGENKDHDLTLSITGATPSTSSTLVLHSAKETIRIIMGRCPCIGRFLAVSVVGSGNLGLEGEAAMRSDSIASLSSKQDKREIAANLAYLGPRCPTGHVAAWEGGAKEFACGNRVVRLTFSPWLTGHAIYTLSVDLGTTAEVPGVE